MLNNKETMKPQTMSCLDKVEVESRFNSWNILLSRSSRYVGGVRAYTLLHWTEISLVLSSSSSLSFTIAVITKDLLLVSISRGHKLQS